MLNFIDKARFLSSTWYSGVLIGLSSVRMMVQAIGLARVVSVFNTYSIVSNCIFNHSTRKCEFNLLLMRRFYNMVLISQYIDHSTNYMCQRRDQLQQQSRAVDGDWRTQCHQYQKPLTNLTITAPVVSNHVSTYLCGKWTSSDTTKIHMTTHEGREGVSSIRSNTKCL